jgi:hypothetical protein
MDAYTLALGPALTCTPGAANQCRVQSLSLNCTGCSFVAEDAARLDTLRVQLLAQSCIHPGNCLCISLGASVCVAADGGSASGTCTSAPPAN